MVRHDVITGRGVVVPAGQPPGVEITFGEPRGRFGVRDGHPARPCALLAVHGGWGGSLNGTVWAKAAKALSPPMNAAGHGPRSRRGGPAGTRALGARAGTLAPIAAAVAYYVTDTLAREAGTDMATWVVAALPFGSVLAAVGATTGRPGVTGPLAR